MLELWQTEWCPASRRIRQRLTELEVDYVIHQVPVDKDERTALVAATGSDIIPVLLDHGDILVGEDAIRRRLDQTIAESIRADAHRLKAERARHRYLEEKCACSQPATR